MTERLGTALLAYIGDAVFSLFVRTLVLDRLCPTPDTPPPPVDAVHRQVEQVVAAEGQARLLGALMPVLTEEEQDVVRRARNARLRRRPRGSNYRSYRRSTGLEALVGYLYLQGQTERLMHLLKLGLEMDEGGRPASNGQH